MMAIHMKYKDFNCAQTYSTPIKGFTVPMMRVHLTRKATRHSVPHGLKACPIKQINKP